MRTLPFLLRGLIVGGSLWFAGCKPESPSHAAGYPSPAAKVKLFTVQPRSEYQTEEAIGTVQARLRATLEARTTARIARLRVAPSQSVATGELLMELDSSDAQARLDQAVAARNLAEKEFKRLQGLIGSKAITQAEFDAAEGRLQLTAAALREAESILSYTRITAPFAGIVTRKLADQGDLAVPGKALLQLEDPQLLRVEVDLPESLLPYVHKGTTMSVNWVNSSSPHSIQAAVSELEPAADPVSRSFRMRLDLPSSSGLQSGQYVKVVVPLQQSSMIRIPASAILKRGQMEVVYVAQNNLAVLRLIRSGDTQLLGTAVLAGLDAGDRIVLDPPTSLREGQSLTEAP